MRVVLAAVAVLLTMGVGHAQEADPAKIKADPELRANPYPLDQRCGPIAQHPLNQGYLNCAAVQAEGKREPGTAIGPESQTFTNRSSRQERGRPTEQPPTRE